MLKSKLPTIAVCICTYRRNVLLTRLLEKMRAIETNNLFTYSIIITDNDSRQSAFPLVKRFSKTMPVPVRYEWQPQKNIALTRNRCIDESESDYVAFIDDDEYPEPKWLIRMFLVCRQYSADAVFGPAKPHFEQKPPRWIVKGKLLERPSYPTGTIITNTRATYTGNAFISRSVFANNERFNPRYGLSGGEDVEFFRRMLARGCVLVWCNDTPVFESVPPARMTRKYLLKRALLRGVVVARRERYSLKGIARSIAAVGIYSVTLPALLLMSHAHFMRILIRFCDHAGKLMALAGLPPIRVRNY
ncbi:MAG: glycosyltransferase [Chitinivibrionales bacterium]|nr:glycosyltransferase [Chitinivibrionales bacterium]